MRNMQPHERVALALYLLPEGGGFAGIQVTFRPRFGLLVKTRGRAARLEEGLTYCVALNRFRSLFPGFKEPQT